MFQALLIFFGLLLLLSILAYIIPQILICILPEQDLKKRYGENSWAFITGGSSGIGKSFALKLAKQGLNIVIVGKDNNHLEEAESELKKENSSISVKAINADLSGNPSEVAKKIVDELQGLDISVLFFNAGFGVVEELNNPSLNSLPQFHTNIVTHQHLLISLYPQLSKRTPNPITKKRGGILFTSSLASFVPPPLMTVYGATKAYLGVLGEYIATEGGLLGIDVVSLYPGLTSTRFGEKVPEFRKSPTFLYQSSSACASRALSALGRFVRVDSGVYTVLVRVIIRLVDINWFIPIAKNVGKVILDHKLVSRQKEIKKN